MAAMATAAAAAAPPPSSSINSDPLITSSAFTTATHHKVLFPSLTDCRRNGSQHSDSVGGIVSSGSGIGIGGSLRCTLPTSTAASNILAREFVPCVGSALSGYTDDDNLSPTESTSAVTPTPTATRTKQQIHVSHRVSGHNRKRWFCLLCTAIIVLKATILFGYFLFFFGRTGRESPEQRLEIITRLLHETPLIGMYSYTPTSYYCLFTNVLIT